VEIPLSKLIKAAQNDHAAVVPFDFLQMEPTQFTPALRSKRADEARNAAPESDAPAEIETTIQNRLLDAERKAQELEEEAYRKGYAQGQKDGFEVGQKSMAIVKEHLEDLFNGLQRLPEKLLEDYREWIISSCLGMARHVARRELAGDSQQLVQLIDALLREAEENHALTLHVNPNDLDLLEKNVDLLHLSSSSGRTFHLKADPRLERGGCRLESDIQLLDASIEKQFELLEQSLRNQESTTDASTP
jgi:flagellar assembly protein FliH